MAASRQSWIRTTSQQVLRKAARRPAGTPAHGAGLVPHLTEGRAFLFRKSDGRGVEGRPQRIEPGRSRGLFPLQFPQR